MVWAVPYIKNSGQNLNFRRGDAILVLLVVLALVRHLVLRLYVYAKNKLFGSDKKKSMEYLPTNSMLKFLFFTKLYNTMELFSRTKIS